MPIERTADQIVQYILINHEYESASELAISLDISRYRVCVICEELNIVPITSVGLLINYAKEHCQHQTCAEMADKLGVRKRYFKEKLREYGICTVDKLADLEIKPKEAPLILESSNLEYTSEQCDSIASLLVDMGIKLVAVRPRIYQFVPIDKEEKRKRRPPAEYNITIGSEIVKELYAAGGIKVKV